jgi:hypothetical protein
VALCAQGVVFGALVLPFVLRLKGNPLGVPAGAVLEEFVTNYSRCLLAVIVALGLLPAMTPGALPSAGKPLGQVLQAERAYLGTAPATVGATIFPGDRLWTDERGRLQVGLSGAQLYLLAESTASLEQDSEGVLGARLGRGTALFSSARAGGMELRVATARIRATGAGPTVGQVTVVGPKELLVMCKRGAMEFAVGEEAETIGEGASYRVLLDPPDPGEPAAAQGPAGAGTKEQQPKKSGRRRRAFLFLFFGTVGAVTGIAVDEVLESPDHP